MKTALIKLAIKQKQDSKRGFNTRNNYKINVTSKDRYRWARRKNKLEYRDDSYSYKIDDKIYEEVKNKWVESGVSIKEYYKIGFNKALKILNNLKNK